MDKYYLQTQIVDIGSSRSRLAWLESHLAQADTIANFGCRGGSETLALMWLIRGQEAVGLDIDADSIDQVQDWLYELRAAIADANRALDYSWTPEEDRDWWDNAPAFFTQRIVASDFALEYRERDMTQPTGLEDNYYDLAYCELVLHHIWYDAASGNGEEDAQSAVDEMAQVVKPGRIVAARERIQVDDQPRLNFTRIFERAGLERLHVQEEETESLSGRRWVGRYVYRKNS